MMGTGADEQLVQYEADPECRVAMERWREIQEQIRPFMNALEQRIPLAPDEFEQVQALNTELDRTILRAAEAIENIVAASRA